MMTSHGKLRKEKGSLAEYESQMKGKCLCASVPFHHTSECASTCMPEFTCALMHALCTFIQPRTLSGCTCAYSACIRDKITLGRSSVTSHEKSKS